MSDEDKTPVVARREPPFKHGTTVYNSLGQSGTFEVDHVGNWSIRFFQGTGQNGQPIYSYTMGVDPSVWKTEPWFMVDPSVRARMLYEVDRTFLTCMGVFGTREWSSLTYQEKVSGDLALPLDHPNCIGLAPQRNRLRECLEEAMRPKSL